MIINMNIFKQLSISSKLFVFFLVPVLTLLFFAGVTISEKRQQLQHTQNSLDFIQISQQLTAVVYELQKERGLSAGIVGSEGSLYQETLQQQRMKTDIAVQQLTLVLTKVPTYLREVDREIILHIKDEFAVLKTIRLDVDTFSTNRPFFEQYSHVITDTLNIVSILKQLSTEINMTSSYVNLLWLEEYSGLERGALNGVISASKFKTNQYSLISSYISGQNAAIREFNNTADFMQQAQLRAVFEQDAAVDVEQYRENIFNRTERNDALNSLLELIGYGGFIHDFKNYVIRGDRKYADAIRQQLIDVNKQLDAYKQLTKLSSDEKQALNTIKNTLQQYHDHLSVVAEMKTEQAMISEIDKYVKVDDGPALMAITLLGDNLISHEPEHWWKQSSHRLDQIHKVTALIANDLLIYSQKKEAKTKRALYVYILLTSFILFFSLILGLKLRARLVNEIKYIADTMQQNNEQHTLLTVTGNDEIADMEIAFNNMVIERRKNEQKLNLASRVFNESLEGIAITDAKANIVDVNPAFTMITGYSYDEVMGKNPSILSSGKQDSRFYKKMWTEIEEHGHWQGEIWNRKKDGELYAELLTISALKDNDGYTMHYVALFSDITQSKHQQEKLNLMAHYDVLTKLPNRALFIDRFHQAIAHSKRSQNHLAICFLDLDNFKPVNDNYGHDVGDQLLIQVAERIESCIREEDTVSRQGGDEFTLLLNDIESQQQCEQTLERLLHALSLPYLIDDTTHEISASMGVTLYPKDDGDIDTLLRHADQSMYQAKQAGRNRYHLFNTEQDQETVQKHHRLAEIAQALKNDEFTLYYQPKVNMVTGEVFGAEALIRWQHPEKGIIPPIDFLPLIDETDLEILIGEWVINQALKQLDEWRKQGVELEISINIASYHLQSADFIRNLELALEHYPEVDSTQFQIEILESSALGDLHTVSTILKACQNALGVNIALDDFGTGYSSLTHLRSLPANTIKIDQSFVRDMLDDPSDYTIIDGIIGLSDSFNRNVIAEGVETSEHGLMLIMMGCDRAQGYGIAKPMPANNVLEWLSEYTPNEEWQAYGKKYRSHKENKVKLFRIITKHWNESFVHNIHSSPESIEHWPIMNAKHCPCGAWIQQAEQEQLFEEGLESFKQAHEEVHLIANAILLKYQEGDIEVSRSVLHDFRTAYDDMSNALGKCV